MSVKQRSLAGGRVKALRAGWRIFVACVATLGVLLAGIGVSSQFEHAVARETQAETIPISETIKADAAEFIDIIEQEYAYADRALGGPDLRARLTPEIAALRTETDLLQLMQSGLHWLADPHAITQTATADAYSLVPSFADLWVEERAGRFIVEDVRAGSPAAKIGVRPGDEVIAIEDLPIRAKISAFWGGRAFEGLSLERRGYAARALVAGERNKARKLTFSRGGPRFTLTLPTLYQQPVERPAEAFSVRRTPDGFAVIRVNDSLGDNESIAKWDSTLNAVLDTSGLILDLRDTASGGNTTVARAIMSRFVSETRDYQRHELPGEERWSGIKRLWVEQVSPRGQRYEGPVVVLYGRWTASMGEGLSIGLQAAAQAHLIGSDFADLLGGVQVFNLKNTRLGFFLPVERLFHVNGTARERCRPNERLPFVDALSPEGEDEALTRAVAFLKAGQARP